MPINSSGSIERFALAPGETKDFVVLHPGGTNWSFDATSEIYQDQQGTMSGSAIATLLQTSEDGTTYTTVTTVTPVAGATVAGTGATGAYARFKNNATTGLVWVVAKPTNRVQVKTSL